MSDTEERLGIEESIQFAKKYLEDLLSFFGLNTDVYATTADGEVIELSVPSTHLNGFLIGQRGDTVRSLQYMVSSALKNNNFGVVRVNVDVANYKKQRADRLAEKAEDWIESVKKSGQPMDLAPMNAADRRVIHQLASDEGLTTESVGEGRDRYVVLKPAGSQSAATEDVDAVDVPDDHGPESSEAEKADETDGAS
ncbi:MAG: spoIIIJ-associated protein [Candidatus Saccharibacteria bacterium]|nr:spoIIIJ-associated protein [Candidatus Saccharibacteria bacterium]